MLYSVVIYLTTALVLICVASIFSLTARNIKIPAGQEIVMASVIALIFAVIFGMRWDVGVDSLAYLYAYKYNDTERFEVEYAFKFINDKMYQLHFHYAIYLGLIAFIQLFLLLYSFKKKIFLWPFHIIALFGGHFFLDWMNVMRQETASCIGFYGIKYVVERKPWKYLLCIVLAFGFHKSALILLPLYPIFVSGKDLTPNKWIQLPILMIPTVLTIFHFDILSRLFPIINTFQELEAFSNYDIYNENVLQSYSEKTKIGFLFYIFIIVNIIIVIYSPKLKSFFSSRSFKIIYNLYFWGCTLELIVATNLVLARPFRYFRIYKLAMIAYIMYYLIKRHTLLSNSMMIVLVGLMFAGIILVASYAPFNFFFEISYAP